MTEGKLPARWLAGRRRLSSGLRPCKSSQTKREQLSTKPWHSSA